MGGTGSNILISVVATSGGGCGTSAHRSQRLPGVACLTILFLLPGQAVSPFEATASQEAPREKIEVPPTLSTMRLPSHIISLPKAPHGGVPPTGTQVQLPRLTEYDLLQEVPLVAIQVPNITDNRCWGQLLGWV